MLLTKLVFKSTLLIVACASYARLTHEHLSVHFAEESNTAQLQIDGTDNAFQSITFSEDYAMMSWVQIQEAPSPGYASIWKIEHGNGHNVFNRTPSLMYDPDGAFQFCVGTSDTEAEWGIVSHVDSYPQWVYAAVIVWSSAGAADARIYQYAGSSSSNQLTFTGTPIPFNTSSKVIIGASNDDQQYFWPKMQVLDLRYYSGTWVTSSDVDDIVNNTDCYSDCSAACWGPGNYSCKTFLTLVDPETSLTLNTIGTPADRFKMWYGSDSFLMGRPFDSDNVAFSGWFKKLNSQNLYVDIWRASKVNWEYGQAGCKWPGMTYRTSDDTFRWCHGDNDGNHNAVTCINQTGNNTLNEWIFVVGSSCKSELTLYSCTGTSSQTVACESTTGSGTQEKFELNTSDASLWVGGRWTDGPGAEFRDVRYYYSKCLSLSEMGVLQDNVTCETGWDVCSDPETCTDCSTNYVLEAGKCMQGCLNNTYKLNGQCYADCGTGYWEYVSDYTCQNCDTCCTEWYGSADTQCTACGNLWYLQPNQVDTCLTTCPTGYFIGNGCEACHTDWATCNNDSQQGWLTCNGGDYLVYDGSCIALCPSNTVLDGNNVCQACHASCATCSNTGIQDCIECLSNYVMDDTNTCQTCHDTCATCSNTEQFDCITCTSGYLVNTGACESQCPNGYVPDTSNVCKSCNPTCATCSDTGPQDCIQCIDGWKRSDDQAQDSTCLCDMPVHENVSLALQFACINAPFSQTEKSGSTKLSYVEEITQRPDITTPDLTFVLDITDVTGFQDTQTQTSVNDDLNQAWITALDNSPETSFSYSEDNVEVYLERGSASSFKDAALYTESGSGVILPSLDDVFQTNDQVQFNVFSYDVDHIYESLDTLVGYVVSIEAFYVDDQRGQSIDLSYLENNVTIVFDDIALNTTLTYECIYLLANYTWSTDGCQISSLLSESAHCSCNHLSQFSLRKFASSAQVDSNIGATVDIDNIKNINIENSLGPIVCLGSLYTFYALLLSLFWKWDKVTETVAKVEFQKLRTKFIKRQTIQYQLENQSSNRLMPESVSRSINEHSSESLKPSAPPVGQDQRQIQAFQEDFIDQMALGQRNNAESQAEIFTGDPWHINVGSAVVEVKSINTENMSSRSNQELQVPGRNREPDAEAQSHEPKVEDKAPQPKPTFKSAFLEKHQILGMLFVKHGLVSRAERLTIVLVLLMCELFAIGLFYDSDRNPDEEETEDEKTVEESVEGMGWRDFWVAIYSMAIVIPIPIILKKIFTRKELDPEADAGVTSKLKRNMKIKRTIGYIISYLAWAWCTWSIIMFSVEFGHNTSQIWLINFAITTGGDIVCKDVCVAAITVFLALNIPKVKEKIKKRKTKYQIAPTDNDGKSDSSEDKNK